MDGLRYRAGTWIALAHNSRVVLLPPDSGQERIDEVWDVMSGGASLDTVFEAVTGGLAGSLSQLPPFALLSVEDQAHVLLRGPLELAVDQGGAAVSGEHLRTWSEQVLPAAGHATLTVTSLDGDAGAGLTLLTLREGMATVSQLEIDLGAVRTGSADVPPEPSPAAARPAVPPPPVPPAPLPPVPPTPLPAVSPTPALSPAPAAPAVPAPAPDPAVPDLSAAVPWLKLTPPPLASADVPLSAPRTAVDDGEPTETLPPVPEDHDGDTIMGFKPQPGTPLPGTPQPETEDEATIRSAPSRAVPSAASQPGASQPDSASQSDSAVPPGTGPTVLARKCPQGHVNPPTAGTCLVCGAEISGEPRPAPRPSLGTMRLSTGAAYELDRNFIIGRQPSASRVQGSVLPRMVQVPSESGDISRSHAEIRLEGWHVMLRDLFSTNGTVLIREGQLPRRLAQGEAAILLDGDVAELGDNISIRFEGLA